jgi:hypothetical protein
MSLDYFAAANAVLAADPFRHQPLAQADEGPRLGNGPRRHGDAVDLADGGEASFNASSRSVFRLTRFHCHVVPVVLATSGARPSSTQRS